MVASLGDLGERRIIAMIRKQYGYTWPDDDASQIDCGNSYMLITTDAISRKSHIPKGADMEAAGYFFAALNLSDIAAMGGKPEYFMAAMTFPKGMKIDEVLEIERGIKKCLAKYAVKLIGGDLKQGSELNMAGIAIGSVSKKRILRRTGARAGDLVCVTGKLGKNAAAYYMWKSSGQKKWANMLIDIEPKVAQGMLISQYAATSAIDLSDGLFSALSQLTEISKRGFEIEYEKIPVSNIAKTVSKKLWIEIEDIAFNFGGEYELLFTIPKRQYAKLKPVADRRGFEISVIGRVAARKAVMLKNGKRSEITKRGYEHF